MVSSYYGHCDWCNNSFKEVIALKAKLEEAQPILNAHLKMTGECDKYREQVIYVESKLQSALKERDAAFKVIDQILSGMEPIARKEWEKIDVIQALRGKR